MILLKFEMATTSRLFKYLAGDDIGLQASCFILMFSLIIGFNDAEGYKYGDAKAILLELYKRHV